MEVQTKGVSRRYHLIALLALAFGLALHLLYLFSQDASRFPIHAIKITASYQKVSRHQLETILSKYANKSYFTFATRQLRQELLALQWIQSVEILRDWPDILKIKITEKTPVAYWNDQAIVTSNGDLIHDYEQEHLNKIIPKLTGPNNQQSKVLQIYKKLSKLLANYHLKIACLELRRNHAWVLELTNGLKLQLGKKELTKRLRRFCFAYSEVLADKHDQIASIDLRYVNGMAIGWKQQMEK